MPSDDFVRQLAVEQRKRLVASLMRHFEAEIEPLLADNVRSQVARAYREKVFQSVGAYHDMILDMLKASVDSGSVINEAAMELLTQIHANQQRLMVRG